MESVRTWMVARSSPSTSDNVTTSEKSKPQCKGKVSFHQQHNNNPESGPHLKDCSAYYNKKAGGVIPSYVRRKAPWFVIRVLWK